LRGKARSDDRRRRQIPGPEFDILPGQYPTLNQCEEFGMRPYLIGGDVVALALLLGAATPAAAQGTDYQRQACTPDAFRLCGAYIPDADRITACLRASGPQLSRPCYEVFFPTREIQQQDRPQNVRPQNIVPRRRDQPPPRDRYRDPYDPYDDED
jgi:hypothetical protein